MDRTDAARLNRLLVLVGIYSVAMGLLEAAVVVYLRDILYPGGFDFPLSPLRPDLVWTEILREIATLVMLLAVGFLAGRNAAERLAWFLFSFAIWDIFYYVFLQLLIGWPGSLMTWDVLFLLPVTWTGPVITPLLVTLLMVALALIILVPSYRNRCMIIPWMAWTMLVSGSVILIIAFTWDYSGYILEHMSFREIWTLPGNQVMALAHEYVPRKFNWAIFFLGYLVVSAGIATVGLTGDRDRK